MLRESLARLGGKELDIGPLTPEESIQLVLSLVHPGEVLPNAIEQRSLARASGGFPLVLELLVEDWRVSGRGSVALALDAMTTEFTHKADPGAAYSRVLLRLMRTLDPPTKGALDLASVLGARLNDLPLYSVMDLTLGQTMAALGKLTAMRLLRDGSKGLEFANELIRAHVYTAVPSPVRRALHSSVSDRLRKAAHLNEPTSELEIAWHTMRAGQIRDAMPHLVEGARRAIRSGAPQNAEKALSSALESIAGEDLLQVSLLLAEALQEQGRWRESLQALEILDQVPDIGCSQEAFALAGLAKGYLGLSASQELIQALPTYQTIILSCPDVHCRIRAARAVAHGVSLLRDRGLARRFLPLLDGIPTSALSVDAKGQLALARALFLFQAGEIEASFREADMAVKELTRRGSANSVAVQLQVGLGIARSLQGRYDEAVDFYDAALSMARRLGNDSLTAGILANLSLVYLRLGRFDPLLQIAEQGRLFLSHRPAEWSDVILTYAVALMHALLGRASAAKEAVARLESRLPATLPSMLLQRWLLWKADILLAAGMQDEASRAATAATSGFEFRLESPGFAGVFARWTAIISLGSELESRACKVLGELEGRLEEFDAVDQVEILCACSHILQNPSGYVKRISAKSSALPKATLALIKTLGMKAVG
jgi:tetratricopeptide (TPR) repeat protein